MRYLPAGLLLSLMMFALGCGAAASTEKPAAKEEKTSAEAPTVATAVAAKEDEPKVDAPKEKAPTEEKKEVNPAAPPPEGEKTGMAKLEAILEREARTKEELFTNIKEAVGVCEELVNDKATDADTLLKAENALVDLLAQGASVGVDGFKDKLVTRFEAAKGADKSSPLLPKMSFHLIRLSNVDAEGKLKPSVMDAINTFLTDYPRERGMAIRLLLDAGESADAVGDTPLAISAFRTIKEKFPDHQVVEMVEGSLRRLEAVGKDFPIEGNLLSGEKLDPALFKGKVVIIDFWATWCGPCVAEIPRLKELYGELKENGLEILGVSLDEEKAELEAFVQEKEIPWPQSFPAEGDGTGWEHPLTNKYGISGIPTLFLIDRAGKLVSTSLRGRELEAKVRELVEAKPES